MPRPRFDMITVYVVRPDAQGRSHEFLQLRRVASDYMGGTWQPVSGAIEPGETAVAGALRELREETGSAPIEFYQTDDVKSFYLAATDDVWHVVCFCAMVRRDAAVVLNPEHDAYRWVARDQVAQTFMWPSDRRVIEGICRELLDGGPAKPYLRIPLASDESQAR